MSYANIRTYRTTCLCHTMTTVDNNLTEVRILGRGGAINLERLDILLKSLKTYWDYSSQKGFIDEITASQTKMNLKIYQLMNFNRGK